MNKTAKAIDSILEELGRQKEYVDQKVVEFVDKINKTEIKTIDKIQDWEDLLKQRVSENYLETMMKNKEERINQSKLP